MANILISDFSYKEMPHGGSEVGNQMLIEEFNLDFIGSRNVIGFSKDDFYVISNISLMRAELVAQIKDYNYIIFECDYKILPSRHPWRHKNDLIPKELRQNYDLYKNAKAVFVKSEDHLNVYKKNDVDGNFINMRTNIWSEDDLQLMERLLGENPEKNDKACIYNTDNWIKNSKGAIDYCDKNNIPYGFIQNGTGREGFLTDMVKYSKLVFFPAARETYCRIIVEAKCLGLDVLTTYVGPSSINNNLNNYGAAAEDYFGLKGKEMINFLRAGNKMNIKKMKKYIPE
jgi:hypothetical protein|tara:strand:- start:7280 stop:8137 length:858 start_codon:yes stop_codon:yes gene_type:complete